MMQGKVLGGRIQAARSAAKVTRAELAEAAMCSISHLSRIETGDRQYASMKLLNRIAAYLTERSGREIPVTEFYSCGCACTHSAA